MYCNKDLIKEINDWTGGQDQFAFWWLGQAGFVLKISSWIIYIDPYLKPDSRRLVPPLLSPCEINNADLVICTHDHEDHIDSFTLAEIAKLSPGAIVVCPRTAAAKIKKLGFEDSRVIALNDECAWQEDRLKIVAVKAKHEFFDDEGGTFPYLGYFIQFDKLNIYHSGDTLNYEGLLTRLQSLRVNIAFLPINGRDATRWRQNCLGNMTYQEAVDIAGELPLKMVIPMHYGMFTDNSENPQLFVNYLQAKFPKIDYWIGEPGEKVIVEV